jgi:signal transduction histidine kinase
MKDLECRVPFILVTGSQTEEVAVACMKEGAEDYILKSALTRLPSAVRNALKRSESEREKAEALSALKKSEEQLLQAEAVGRLAGGISHDFNNLLTAIIGYSDLSLRRLQTNDPMRRNLEEIKKASERAASLTRQLLAFSRKQVMQPKVFDLNSVVTDLEKMLVRMIGEDIELQTVLKENPGNVKADPGQIEQVLMNLVINARDAMPMGGKLTIETGNVYLDQNYAYQHVGVTPGTYVMIAVSDSGTGMDDETRNRIFEPFFTTKEIGKGTGLGLSTVYGIVKQSGGNIWVYSELGKGTTFKIYLPRVNEGAEDYRDVLETEDLALGTETVLLVEDDELVRNLAREVLESSGYRVLEAATGASALLLCEKHNQPIDLLLTDVVMPEMSGRNLADRLLQLHPEMRVLFMSGYTENSIVHHGVLDKEANFIQKPFTPGGLALRVREVLDEVKTS